MKILMLALCLIPSGLNAATIGYQGPLFGSGLYITNIPAASINAGSLGSSVISSSVTQAAIFGSPTILGTNVTAIPSANISAGALNKVTSVTASSITTVGDGLLISGGEVFFDTGLKGVHWADGTVSTTAAGTASGITGVLTAGKLPKASGASALDDSTIYDSGTGLTTASSMTVGGQVGAASFKGSGAGLTALTAANVSAGSLPVNVIASSITQAAMFGSPTLLGTNITAIPAASISAGDLGASVKASSVAASSVLDSAIVSVAASKIDAGNLGASVKASSVAAGSVLDSAIVNMAASKVNAGSLGGSVIASSITQAAMFGDPTFNNITANRVNSYWNLAQLISTTTQHIVNSTTAQPVEFSTQSVLNIISRVSSTTFQITEAGQYGFLLSFVYEKSNSPNGTMCWWLRVNNADVPNSNTCVVALNGEDMIMAVDLIQYMSVGDKFSIWMYGSATTCQLTYTAAGANPTRPASPSAIMTVKRLGL